MPEQAQQMFAGLAGVAIWILFLVMGFVFLGILAFWVWMLVDCVQRDFPPQEQNAKIVWILVIVLAGWIGALIYFFVVKKAKPRGP